MTRQHDSLLFFVVLQFLHKGLSEYLHQNRYGGISGVLYISPFISVLYLDLYFAFHFVKVLHNKVSAYINYITVYSIKPQLTALFPRYQTIHIARTHADT